MYFVALVSYIKLYECSWMCGPDATWSVQSQELELVSDHSGLCLPESGLPSLEADTDM